MRNILKTKLFLDRDYIFAEGLQQARLCSHQMHIRHLYRQMFYFFVLQLLCDIFYIPLTQLTQL